MIDRIMALRASGMTYAEIAHTVGLSMSRVGELVRREERRDLIAANFPDRVLAASPWGPSSDGIVQHRAGGADVVY